LLKASKHQEKHMTLRMRVAGLGCSVLVAGGVVLSISAQTSKPNATVKSAPAVKSAVTAKAPATSHPKETAAKEWPDYAGSPEGNRFMDLKQITKTNVDKLDVAWSYPYAETGFNPIVAHGIIYTKARNKSVVAIDAATGKEIWIHDGLTGMTERGMNYWESKDGKDRRIIFSLADYLQEIDATSGKSIRSFGTNGAVDLRLDLRRDPEFMRIQSGTAGKVFEDLIILGSATGEAYFSPPGDIRAYNVVTGKLAWQFHTVPHPGEPGYETWPKDAWKYIGGVNDWGELSVDSARGIAFISTGSATFDFYGADRVGNDLYANCLLALDAHTGKLLWHFQNVHHDLWDYDDVAAPMLTTITKDGKKIDVVALAGKTGYLYVFNRMTGAPIWPIPETPVPHETSVPGEVVSPTQPIPSAPPAFTAHDFTPAQVNPYILTADQRAAMVARVSKARYQGPFTPIGFDEAVHMPGNQGGANWGMTSANPNDGSVYVIAFNYPTLIKDMPAGQSGPNRFGGSQGPGPAMYAANCASCHGANRAGTPGSIPPLTGIGTRLSRGEIQAMIMDGKGQMPAFHQFNGTEVDALVAYLMTADAAVGRGAFGRGGPALTFPPGPVVETGPAVVRPETAGRTSGMSEYPEGVTAPNVRLTMDGYGVQIEGRQPPYTSLTAYDLNKGTIKWQIGLGDDYRVVKEAGIHGTGAAETLKSSSIITSTGLVIVNAADRKIHFYDADNGKELRSIPMGAVTSGSPSMFELNGKQYLLVTASSVGTRQGGDNKAADPAMTGPVGLVAIALKQ
jgi:quinoprotein glucose dehydrogenase